MLLSLRSCVPRAGVVVPPRVDDPVTSSAMPSPASDLEGIRLRCASHGRSVLRLPQSLPRALRQTLAREGSSPGGPTQSGLSRGLVPLSPTHLDGAPETRPTLHLDVDLERGSSPQVLEREVPGLNPSRRSSLRRV